MFEQLKLDDYTRTHIQVKMMQWMHRVLFIEIYLWTANSLYIQREAKERVKHSCMRETWMTVFQASRVYFALSFSLENTRNLILFCQTIPYFAIISFRFWAQKRLMENKRFQVSWMRWVHVQSAFLICFISTRVWNAVKGRAKYTNGKLF